MREEYIEYIKDLLDEAYRIGGSDGRVYLCTECKTLFAHSQKLIAPKPITCDKECLSGEILEIGKDLSEVLRQLIDFFGVELEHLILEPDEDTIEISLTN